MLLVKVFDIQASLPQSNNSPIPDTLIALSYFELLANTHGIGTLWNGMLQWAIDNINPQLRDMLGIPKDHVIGYVILFGKPAVKYARSIQTKGAHIHSIKIEN